MALYKYVYYYYYYYCTISTVTRIILYNFRNVVDIKEAATDFELCWPA